MAGRIATVTLAVSLLGAFAAPTLRGEEKSFMLILKGSLTTSSQIYTNPDAPDPIDRSQYTPLKDSFGYGLELNYRIPETNIAVSLSADYIDATTSASILRIVPVTDGYTVIPVELTGYFIIPLSGPTFGIFMGGGAGLYFGERHYQIGGVDAPAVSRTPGFGIHVLGGISYRFNEWFSLVGEMKFRDVQFSSRNSFGVSDIVYQGVLVHPAPPGDANIHTDGVIFQLGAAFNLPW